MPANLTPQYIEAEEAYKRATTPEDRLAALENMLRCIPKHKGTEKMQADIKKRIARAREEGRAAAKKGRPDPYRVEREGAAQVFVVGPPNSGKSSLVGALTNARVVVAEYPFATTSPVPGMMRFENILIQLVDMPPMTRDMFPPAMAAAIRASDGLLVTVDVSSDDCADVLEECLTLLDEGRAIREGQFMSVVATKLDLPGAADNADILADVFPGRQLLRVSAAARAGLDLVPGHVFGNLGIIRVCSKPPGKPADWNAPFVLKKGDTVGDLARAIHKDLYANMKTARVWGSAKFDGQSVPREYVLSDGDIVEFRT
jgi:ribosome-interacting GTPase 1